MTCLAIRKVPDPVLRATCAPVTDFDAALERFAQDLLETMYAAPGRGLAAPQVGVTQRIFVMDPTWKEDTPDPMVFVNPTVVAASATTARLEEACLSIPDRTITVARPDAVTLRWQDAAGQQHEREFTGFAAACTQHEMDHLDGILITDKPA